MPFITAEMVTKGTQETNYACDADIIQGMGGLGGCKTMEQAPPEVAKWFDRKCSVAEIMFGAMDPLCARPYGQEPSLEMIAAGNKVLDLLFNVALFKPMVQRNATLMAEVPLDLHPYLLSEETPCAHVYRKMREVGGLICVDTPGRVDIMDRLAERNAQIEIIEKSGKVSCYRTEYRSEKRRTVRTKIASQKASLVNVSPESRASMYDFEVDQLQNWLEARARQARTDAIAAELDNADQALSRMTEALRVPSIAHGLEHHKARSIWMALQALQDQLNEAGFTQPH